MYTLIVVSAVAVFTVCEADNVSKRSGSCDELIKCLAIFGSFGSTDISRIALYAKKNSSYYSELILATNNFLVCFAFKKATCDNPAIIGNITIPKEIQYLLSVEGILDRVWITNSPCVENQRALRKAKKRIERCKHKFDDYLIAIFRAQLRGEPKEPVVCQFVDSQNTCAMSSLTRRCGVNFSKFVKKIWDRAFAPYTEQMNCDRTSENHTISSAGDKRRR